MNFKKTDYDRYYNGGDRGSKDINVIDLTQGRYKNKTISVCHLLIYFKLTTLLLFLGYGLDIIS